MSADSLSGVLTVSFAWPQTSKFYRSDLGKQHVVLERRHRNFIRRIFALCRGRKPGARVFAMTALLFCFDDARSIELFFDELVRRHPPAAS